MEKQVFELFMKLRFPKVINDTIYYNEWKQRFEGNPCAYMDFDSLKVFKEVLNIIYLNSINRIVRGK